MCGMSCCCCGLDAPPHCTTTYHLRIPTGFRPKAQGCEVGQSGSDRATLGHRPVNISNRNAVAAGITHAPVECQIAATALRLMI